jgi:hypothetical protein
MTVEIAKKRMPWALEQELLLETELVKDFVSTSMRDCVSMSVREFSMPWELQVPRNSLAFGK